MCKEIRGGGIILPKVCHFLIEFQQCDLEVLESCKLNADHSAYENTKSMSNNYQLHSFIKLFQHNLLLYNTDDQQCFQARREQKSYFRTPIIMGTLKENSQDGQNEHTNAKNDTQRTSIRACRRHKKIEFSGFSTSKISSCLSLTEICGVTDSEIC